MEKLKIVVTGSDGFIGGQLIKSTQENFTFIPFIGDLSKISDIENFFSAHVNIFAVVHLAGMFRGQPGELFINNVVTTFNLLDVMQKYTIQKIVFSSTGAVYGNNLSKSIESDSLNPIDIYGLSKKISESVITTYANINNFKYVILRFPNVYGPGSKRGVIYDFYQSISERKMVNLYGDGKQRRDFLYIADAISAIMLAIKYEYSDIFNITSGQNYSLLELLSEFKKYYSFNINTLPNENKLNNLFLDGNKSKEILGFIPKYLNLQIKDISKW